MGPVFHPVIKAAVNVLVCVLHEHVFISLGWMPRRAVSGCVVVARLVVLGKCQAVSRVTVPFYVPASSVSGPVSLLPQ